MGELEQTKQAKRPSSDAPRGARHAQLFALLRQGTLEAGGRAKADMAVGAASLADDAQTGSAYAPEPRALAQSMLPHTAFMNQAAQSFDTGPQRDMAAGKSQMRPPHPATTGKGILKRLYPNKLARAARDSGREAG